MAASHTVYAERLPGWVPEAARNYLVHTEAGLSIRALAREQDCHASTILRQVRRFENRRDDPLVDDALRMLSRLVPGTTGQIAEDNMSKFSEIKGQGAALTETQIEAQALRLLRRLCESGAVMAVARDMEMAVIVREAPDGSATRTAVTDRTTAQALALRDWIACADPSARIARYAITQTGRAALKRLVAEGENRARDEAGDDDWNLADPDSPSRLRHMRSALTESPLAGLARRRDKDGQFFLTRDLVNAGERLREDFELANMGPHVTQNWDRFLTGPDHSHKGDAMSGGSSAARDRVAAALADLGPGLGDVVLRCCCYLEGLETAEKKMGWAARSGKIVLRIALQRLKRHYEEQGRFAPKIG